MENKSYTICYFGNYNPDFSRNKIYIEGLRHNGFGIIECRDSSRGILKFIKLFLKHWKIKNDYDLLIVGYPGHLVVPFAKVISSKRIVVDALGSIYDAEMNSYRPNFWRRIKSLFIDYMMVRFADAILLESGEQKKFFEQRFGPSDKYKVIYTGADESFVKEARAPLLKKGGLFEVLFRGRLNPESGIMYVLEAANILKGNHLITFKIIGSGFMENRVRNFIKENRLINVELIAKFLDKRDLVANISKADLMLGQFENNARLNRTIPHKAFEAFAMGIPYLTGRAKAAQEIMQDNDSAFMANLADGKDLADKIDYLSKNEALRERVSKKAQAVFKEKFSSGQLLRLVKEVLC